MRKMCLSAKFPHQEIRQNYSIFPSVLAVAGMKFQRYLRSKTDKFFKIFLINDQLFVLTQLQDLFKRIVNDSIKASKTFHSILLPDIRNI